MNFRNVIASVSANFRRRRMQRFVREFRLTPATLVLDIGGTPENWHLLETPPRVVLLNMPRADAELTGASSWVAGDGCALPFRDGAFDVVFSNSVIEHVGNAARQESFAREAARVGRSYWIQTPNRWFPVEQHLLTPLVHWLPRGWREWILPRATVWSAAARVSPDQREFYLRHFLDDIRLLGAGELRAFFPGCRLIRERFCGLTKSLIVYKR